MKGAGRLLMLALLGVAAAPAAPVLLDGFEEPALWQAAPADGVALSLSAAPGRTGRALRFDFDFQGHAGYAIARRQLPLDLPENYEFSFWLKARAPVNTLEFKLVDASGENVWWHTRHDFHFPSDWQRVRIKRRQIAFAWGPAGGGELRRLAALEIVVTASTGGEGTLWLDDLTLRALPAEDARPPQPRFSASSSAQGDGPERMGDGDSKTGWHSQEGDDRQTVDIDLGGEREYGGLVVEWDGEDYAADYDVETADEGGDWKAVFQVRGGNGGRDPIYLPESEGRHLRLELKKSARGKGYGIREARIEPISFSASPNAFFAALAKEAPRGTYPRAYSGEQSYWTVLGAPPDGPTSERALFGEDGAVELGESPCSIEPFLEVDGRRLAWSDAEIGQSLEDGYLPIPTVSWKVEDLSLAITPFVARVAKHPVLFVRYRVAAHRARRVRLLLAIRPLQVNPPPQFLNRAGGVGEIRTISFEKDQVGIDGRRRILPLTPPTASGAAGFAQGEIGERLPARDLPRAARAEDPLGWASGFLAYDLALAPGRAREVAIAVPLNRSAGETARPRPADCPADSLSLPSPTTSQGPRPQQRRTAAPAVAPSLPEIRAQSVAARLRLLRQLWHRDLDRVGFTVPPSAAPSVAAARSNLAYILLNRDGPALQPGARAYARAWIRDGALISSALLRLGVEPPVRRFLTWYAGFQYPDGKVPCCVDRRGADPVPENDSPGELLFLIAEHYRFTRDRALVERLWPHVEKTVAFLDSLRQERRTERHRTEEGGLYYGLLPPSISHEGYSSRPAYSYWDDFFALKGLKDAVYLAGALGRRAEEARFTRIRDEFRADLFRSLNGAIAHHKIDFLPGAADLGDFDATSTTIALSPVDELPNLPQAELRRTFERYFEEFQKRRDSPTWEAYTPYELRAVGAFVRLGWRERAHELLASFLGDLRPRGWNQWPEVVWREPRLPRFLGDLPHAWVGSDYLRSFLDLFAYERESDASVVLAAGLPPTWIERLGGAGIRGLRTRYGTLSYVVKCTGKSVRLRLTGKSEIPPRGFVLSWPYEEAPARATINGRPLKLGRSKEIAIRVLPATVEVQRRPPS